MVNSFLEIFPQLFAFILVIIRTACGERVLRRSADVVSLGIMVELVLLKNPVNVEFSELERTLIHAFFLSIVYFCTVLYMVELFFNKFSGEGCKLFKSDDKSLLILWQRIRLKFLHDIEVDFA